MYQVPSLQDFEALRQEVSGLRADYQKELPPPDVWLTIPEAAKYARLTEGHMRLLVLGRPYRAASPGKAEREAIAPKIPRGDTGFAKGARVRRSAVDAYLTRHGYRQA